MNGEKITYEWLCLFWNEIALEANRVSHTDREQNKPMLSSRELLVVHLAMYDAYAGVVKDQNLPFAWITEARNWSIGKSSSGWQLTPPCQVCFPSQRGFLIPDVCDGDTVQSRT